MLQNAVTLEGATASLWVKIQKGGKRYGRQRNSGALFSEKRAGHSGDGTKIRRVLQDHCGSDSQEPGGHRGNSQRYLAAIPPQKPNCLQGFLGRITRNGAIDRWRRRTAEKRGGEMELALEELGECIPSGDQVEREVEARELGRVLEQFLGTLPEEKRRMFLLRYWYLMPNREIAQRLGWTEGRVRTTLHRVRRQLMTYLQERGMLDEA